jgi:hypothetical protein
MNIGQEHFPLFAGNPLIARLTIDQPLSFPGSTVNKGPSVARIMQDLQDTAMIQRCKNYLPRTYPTGQPAGPQNPWRTEDKTEGLSSQRMKRMDDSDLLRNACTRCI